MSNKAKGKKDKVVDEVDGADGKVVKPKKLEDEDEEDLEDIKARLSVLEEKLDPLTAAVKKRKGVIPSPLSFTNPRLLKEPLFWLLYFQDKEITNDDLKTRFEVRGPLVREMEMASLRAYTSDKHVPNGFVLRLVEKLVQAYSTMAKMYLLFPEGMDADEMLEELKDLADSARDAIDRLDSDFVEKNHGRKAAMVLKGAMSLDMKNFSFEKEWAIKKASTAFSASSNAPGTNPKQNGKGGKKRKAVDEE